MILLGLFVGITDESFDSHQHSRRCAASAVQTFLPEKFLHPFRLAEVNLESTPLVIFTNTQQSEFSVTHRLIRQPQK